LSTSSQALLQASESKYTMRDKLRSGNDRDRPRRTYTARPAPTAAPNKFHYGNITWALLDSENIALANEVFFESIIRFVLTLFVVQLRVMCLEYGYDMDPDVVPQVRASHKFTA
jgi:hypothetical protein